MIRRAAFFLFPALLLLAQKPEPWKESDLIQTNTLAESLKTRGDGPAVLYVGFPVLYRAAHIQGAVLAGPATKPEGIEALKQAAAKISKDANIVLYCGCCPFTKCPNVRPAFQMLHELGYAKVKLVVIPTSLTADWIDKGFPVEKAAGASGN